MELSKLSIRDFRCFKEAQLELNPNLNWIIGQNASGKTSLLEALFFLGHGRSFRSNRPDRLIREGGSGFEVVARLSDNGRQRVLGVGRKAGVTEVHLGGETLRGMAEAAKALPVVILDSGMNELVSGGPGERRRWFDWGVFHVEQAFLATWREYRQALRQRNQALKAGASSRALAPWTQAVVRFGESLATYRRGYFEEVLPTLLTYVERALPGVEAQITLKQGWAEEESLATALERHEPRDREIANTRYGPHRADIQLRIGGVPAEERLSRGQQKILAGALWLGQVQSFICRTGRRPLLLVDDLAAELDSVHLDRLLALLRDQEAQLLITAISEDEISHSGLEGGRVFHVEHGQVQGAE